MTDTGPLPCTVVNESKWRRIARARLLIGYVPEDQKVSVGLKIKVDDRISRLRQQSYVCLACRRHQRIRALRRQQLRYNSHLAHAQPSPSADEWFANLNNISDSYGTSKPQTPTPAPTVDAKPKKVDKTKKQFPTLQSRFHALRASLDTRIGHVAGRKSLGRERTNARHPGDIPNSGVRKPPSLEDSKLQTRRLQKPITRSSEERDAETAQMDTPPDCYKEESAQRVGFTTIQELEEPPGPIPLPAFTDSFRSQLWPKSVDSVTVPSSQALRIASGQVRATNEVRISSTKNWRAKTSPTASGLGGPISIPDAPKSSFANRLQVQKTQARFGIANAKPETSEGGASFYSLRNADRVSPEKPVLTSVTSTPYGIGLSQNGNMGCSPVPAETHRNSLPDQGSPGTIASTLDVDSKQEHKNQQISVLEHEQQTSISPSIEPVSSMMTYEEDAEKSASEAAVPTKAGDHRMDHFWESEPVATEINDPASARLTALHDPRHLVGKHQYGPSFLEPAHPAKHSQRPEANQQDTVERHSSASANTASNSAATNIGSSSTGSGDDGSHRPPDDFDGVSISQAMKAAGRARTRRARRKPSRGRPANQKDDSDKTGKPPLMEEDTPEQSDSIVVSITPNELHVEPLDIPQPPVPYLEYGLDRTLFNPGVYQLQDPASRAYNFDPYLQNIMPISEFDFNSLKEYKTSSQDQALSNLAKEHDKKYIGSTSSMTSTLAQFHYLLSNWRPLNLGMLSHDFVTPSSKTNMTQINRAPSAIFLRWKNGTYAIDADKEYDGANVLMLLGKSMELLLTLPKSDYERYRKSDPRQVPEEQKTSPESYQYTAMRDFLMRSQLDAYDPRLPGNGTFDLKTRAVVSVRMQAKEFEPMTGYEIFSLHGKWNSYEREYYDMMRSTMLKYMLQARMGCMNGIFVAYHNVKRIFGFHYIPMQELDRALHGQVDSCLGDQEFKASLDMLNEVLNKATAKFPDQSLRFHFETQSEQNGMPTALHVFAEPMADEEIDRIQSTGKAKIAAFERDIMGKSTEVDADIGESGTEQSVSANDETEDEHVVDDELDVNTASSDSNADVDFLSAIEKSSGEELKPLFYATIIVQSRVNGEVSDGDRPTELQKDDKWEIDYILKEYTIRPRQWALYEDMKARRKVSFAEGREDEDEGDPESEGQSKRSDGFIQMLRSLSDKSREARARMDEMDAGREQVWIEKGLSRDREQIGGVEDYIKWLYR